MTINTTHIKFLLSELDQLKHIVAWIDARTDQGFDVEWNFSLGTSIWICVPPDYQRLTEFLDQFGSYVTAAGPSTYTI